MKTLTLSLLLLAGASIRQDEPKFWSRLAHLRSRFMSADEGEGGNATERVFTHAEWLRLDNARQLLRQAWADFFKEHDVLLCPAAPTVAVPHDPQRAWHERRIVIKGKSTSPADPTFWGGFFTVAYLPATVAPAETVIPEEKPEPEEIKPEPEKKPEPKKEKPEKEKPQKKPVKKRAGDKGDKAEAAGGKDE